MTSQFKSVVIARLLSRRADQAFANQRERRVRPSFGFLPAVLGRSTLPVQIVDSHNGGRSSGSRMAASTGRGTPAAPCRERSASAA